MIKPPLINPARELLRLRKVLQIDWDAYNAWLFAQPVNSIVELHVLDCGHIPLEEVSAILRAEYVTRVWSGTL